MLWTTPTPTPNHIPYLHIFVQNRTDIFVTNKSSSVRNQGNKLTNTLVPLIWLLTLLCHMYVQCVFSTRPGGIRGVAIFPPRNPDPVQEMPS